MNAQNIIEKYIKFFEKRGHRKIPNSPLVPENDPTTLFTSSGMQPLVPYLLGEGHPSGKRLVNVQNCFRAVDIDEVGDNRHTTFFRMLGNWSLGDPASPGEDSSQGGYFKEEEIPWLWEFLTRGLSLPKEKLYITVFAGYKNIPYDRTSEELWKGVFERDNIDSKVFPDETNWWSRSGPPDKMPAGEPGGPDTEVYFRFDDINHGKDCGGDDPTKCKCGKFLEIANSVFMQYKKTENGFEELPNKNVDFGGGLERLLAAVEDKSDIFQTSLFAPIISSIEQATGKDYKGNEEAMRVITDHLTAASFLSLNNVSPSNKEQGYILRRLIRRSLDNLYKLESKQIEPILEAIVEQYGQTDPDLSENFVRIKSTILEEEQGYKRTLGEAKKFISKRYKKVGDELMSQVEISADDAFLLYTSYGLSPTQIKSLGFIFNDQEFAEKMEEHQKVSRAGAGKKFAGGLADTSEQTIRGHTATHLMHQAIRDLLGNNVYQKGSNITSERVRFDFNFDRNLTEDEIKELEQKVNEKIKENLPVKFELMSVAEAKKIGAIGLFDDKYSDKVKIYFIGGSTGRSTMSSDRIDSPRPYSVEFCGGPHVSFTNEVKSFKIIRQENIGNGLRRIYAKVG